MLDGITLTVYQAARLFAGGEPRCDETGKIVNWVAPCVGTRVSMSWDEFVHWTANPAPSESKEGAGGYSLAQYRGNIRRSDACEFVYALALDFDKGGATATAIAEKFSTTKMVAYSTHSSTIETPRCRAVIAVSRPMTANEYADVWDYASTFLRHFGLEHDRATRDPARLWYSPALRDGGHWEHAHHDGRTVDVDEAVREMTQRRDREKLERASRLRVIPGDRRDFQKYFDKVDAAISGQSGHAAAFRAACIVVANVPDEASQLAIMQDYNARCQPPWSDKDLLHKLEGARKRSDLKPLEERKRP